VKAAVQTADGVYTVDVNEEIVLEFESGSELEPVATPKLSLPRLVAAAGSGSTIVAVLDRRPPLAISYDLGSSWSEAGGGLPAGRAVDLAEDDPDRVLYAARNRLYVSTDGGRFWRGLGLELPEIQAVRWLTA
jgi:hypothetical protein